MSKKRKKDKPGVCASKVSKTYLVTPPRTLSGGDLRKLMKEYVVDLFCLKFYRHKQMLSEFNYFNGTLHAYDAWFHVLGVTKQEFQEISDLFSDETIACEAKDQIEGVEKKKQEQIKKAKEAAPKIIFPGAVDRREFETVKVAFDRKLGGENYG